MVINKGDSGIDSTIVIRTSFLPKIIDPLDSVLSSRRIALFEDENHSILDLM